MVLNSSGKVNPVTDGISWPHHHVSRRIWVYQKELKVEKIQ